MFQWDAGNIDKNMRHGVHDWEIEEALFDPRGRRIGSAIVNSEERYIWLGRATSSGKSFTPSDKTRQGILCSAPSAPLRCLPLSKEGIAVNETYCKKISS